MRRSIPWLLACASLVLLASCGGDEELVPEAVPSPSPVTTETVVEEPVDTSPEVEADQPDAQPTAGFLTPQEAALHFYDDWHAQDELAAAGYATQEAIDELFSYPPSNMEFMDCSEEGDHFLCFFYYEGGGMNMTIVDTDAYGYIVTDIGFIAD